MPRVFVLLAAFSVAAVVQTQSNAKVEFDTVSIKPHVPMGTISEACNPHSDPILLGLVGSTLEQLVELAYDLKGYQVRMKGAAWIEADR